MKDNVLKKEFQERDVQRLRNLIQGKQGEKTRTSVGFSKADEFHAEGDIWESDGRTWTIKDGIKQNITKLDKAKKAHVMPLLCPKCKKVMKNRNDKPFYNIHKMGPVDKQPDLSERKSDDSIQQEFDKLSKRPENIENDEDNLDNKSHDKKTNDDEIDDFSEKLPF